MLFVPDRALARTLALALMLGFAGFGLAACDDPGPAEEAGGEAGEAIDDAGEAIQDAID